MTYEYEQYLEKVKESFNSKFNAILPQYVRYNDFEKQVFVIVYNTLSTSNDGNHMIEIPTLELGACKYEENYAKFISAVVNASVIRRFGERIRGNIDNAKMISDNDIFIHGLENRNPIIRVRMGNYAINLNELLAENITERYLINAELSKPRLLPRERYRYNSENAQKGLRDYSTWLDSVFPGTRSNFIYEISQTDLVICHDIKGLNDHLRGIPYATINEDGTIECSLPVEPLVYLARSTNVKAKQILEERRFENVIFIGDKKFNTPPGWGNFNGYVVKNLYIGHHRPIDPINISYRFSTNEVKYLYGLQMSEWADFNAENRELENVLENLTNLFKQYGLNIDPFKDLLHRIRYNTTLIENNGTEDLNGHYFSKYFTEKLEESLFTGTITDYEFLSLTECFQHLIAIAAKGNRIKLDMLRNLLGRDSRTVVFMENKHEVWELRRKYKNTKNVNFLWKRSFKKTLKNFAYKKCSNKRETYVLMGFDKKYNGSPLQCIDALGLKGSCHFASMSLDDSRFKSLKISRLRYESEVYGSNARELMNGIHFVPTTHQDDENLEIEDFPIDENLEYRSNSAMTDRFIVEFTDGKSFTINGKVVVDEEAVEVDEIEANDYVKIYVPNWDLLENVWRLKHTVLARQIDEYAPKWRARLDELKMHHNGDQKGLYKELKKNGLGIKAKSFNNYFDRNDTVFPQRHTLIAILKTILKHAGEGESDKINKEFEMIMRAERAYNSSRINIGRDLDDFALSLMIGQTVDRHKLSFLIETENENLLNILTEDCIKEGTVRNVRRRKYRRENP
jgi:hypothetical protein